MLSGVKEWLFFKPALNNSNRALSKCDLALIHKSRTQKIMSSLIHLKACVYAGPFVDKHRFRTTIQFIPVGKQEINKVPGLFDKLNLK